LNKLLDKELAPQKTKYDKNKTHNRYSIMVLRKYGYTGKEVEEILSQDLKSSTIAQHIAFAKETLKSLRMKKDKTDKDCESIWIHKKLLAGLEDDEEKKTYIGFSVKEMVEYCDKMIQKVRDHAN